MAVYKVLTIFFLVQFSLSTMNLSCLAQSNSVSVRQQQQLQQQQPTPFVGVSVLQPAHIQLYVRRAGRVRVLIPFEVNVTPIHDPSTGQLPFYGTNQYPSRVYPSNQGQQTYYPPKYQPFPILNPQQRPSIPVNNNQNRYMPVYPSVWSNNNINNNRYNNQNNAPVGYNIPKDVINSANAVTYPIYRPVTVPTVTTTKSTNALNTTLSTPKQNTMAPNTNAVIPEKKNDMTNNNNNRNSTDAILNASTLNGDDIVTTLANSQESVTTSPPPPSPPAIAPAAASIANDGDAAFQASINKAAESNQITNANEGQLGIKSPLNESMENDDAVAAPSNEHINKMNEDSEE